MDKDEIRNFYAHDMEANRLEQEVFKLEGIRTKEIIDRYIRGNNLEILDVGGGAGYYSYWLEEKGHNVTLVDLTPRNIELAKEYGEMTGRSLRQLEVGDATSLRFDNDRPCVFNRDLLKQR